jgi:hypothetical protein
VLGDVAVAGDRAMVFPVQADDLGEYIASPGSDFAPDRAFWSR